VEWSGRGAALVPHIEKRIQLQPQLVSQIGSCSCASCSCLT